MILDVTLDDLINACTRIGVNVVFLPFHLAGAYIHAIRTVVVDSRLSPIRQRCVLAHEYVHALRGDDSRQSEYVEARIDERAALLLVSAVEYEMAERLYGGSCFLLAEALDVTPGVVEAYRRVLGKTRAL